MKWMGKIVGAALGLATGLGPVGAAIGLVIGHAYDEKMESGDDEPPDAADAATIREVFFRNAFRVMGFVAKADGRVSEREIAAAREIFRQFRLDDFQTRRAIEYFNAGKSQDFDLESALAELRAACGRRHDILRVFLEVQIRAALLGNDMQGGTRSLMGRIAQRLGVSTLEFAHLEALLRLQGYGAGRPGAGHAGQGGGAPATDRRESLEEAYEALEVSPAATDAEVKRAYRRQMSQNHPDKLVSRGLPESMLEVAKQKTQAIQQAYERIRSARGMR